MRTVVTLAGRGKGEMTKSTDRGTMAGISHTLQTPFQSPIFRLQMKHLNASVHVHFFKTFVLLLSCKVESPSEEAFKILLRPCSQ
jgi:hypothetical protein